MVGELRSQSTYLRTGVIAGSATPGWRRRVGSFAVEKALWLLMLAPYTVFLGVPRMAVILVVAMSAGSLIAAVVVAVGHINLGPVAKPGLPGNQWAAHLVRTTAFEAWLVPVAVQGTAPSLRRGRTRAAAKMRTRRGRAGGGALGPVLNHRRRARTVRRARTSQHAIAMAESTAGIKWSSSREAATAQPNAVRFAPTS